MILDPGTRKVEPLLETAFSEGFKGLNDLHFADNGDLYFTDQRQSGISDPSGRVWLFFFKQKTAYEMPKSLEFRRVLFRSDDFGRIEKCRAGAGRSESAQTENNRTPWPRRRINYWHGRCRSSGAQQFNCADSGSAPAFEIGRASRR